MRPRLCTLSTTGCIPWENNHPWGVKIAKVLLNPNATDHKTANLRKLFGIGNLRSCSVLACPKHPAIWESEGNCSSVLIRICAVVGVQSSVSR